MKLHGHKLGRFDPPLVYVQRVKKLAYPDILLL